MATTSAPQGDTSTAGKGGEKVPVGSGDRAATTTRPARASKAVTNNLLADNGTRLDDYNDAPSTVQPGDAPADTKDATEIASTVGGDKMAAALAGHQTVNAAVPMDPEKFRAGLAISSSTGSNATDGGEAGGRWEEYDLTRPNGTVAHVRRNLDTGEQHVS